MRWVLAMLAFLLSIEALGIMSALLKYPYPRRVCRQRSHDAARMLYLYVLVVITVTAVIFGGR